MILTRFIMTRMGEPILGCIRATKPGRISSPVNILEGHGLGLA